MFFYIFFNTKNAYENTKISNHLFVNWRLFCFFNFTITTKFTKKEDEKKIDNKKKEDEEESEEEEIEVDFDKLLAVLTEKIKKNIHTEQNMHSWWNRQKSIFWTNR